MKETNVEQRQSAAAITSIIAAVGSYIATCSGHPIWGLIAALVSIPAGLIGFVLAASPRIRGGMISLAAIALGVIGLVISILGIVGVIGGALL